MLKILPVFMRSPPFLSYLPRLKKVILRCYFSVFETAKYFFFLKSSINIDTFFFLSYY